MIKELLNKSVVFPFLAGLLVGVLLFWGISSYIAHSNQKKVQVHEQLMLEQYNTFVASTYNLSEMAKNGQVDWISAVINIERGDITKLEIDGLIVKLTTKNNEIYTTKQPTPDSYKEFVNKSKNKSIVIVK